MRDDRPYARWTGLPATVIAKFHYTDPTRARHGHGLGHGLFCGETPLGLCGSVRVRVRVRVVEFSYNNDAQQNDKRATYRRVKYTQGRISVCGRPWAGSLLEAPIPTLKCYNLHALFSLKADSGFLLLMK